MPEYTVHLSSAISTAVTVQADSPEDAIEAAWESPDMPGSMAHGAFGTASVDESGEWAPVAVTNADGEEVWAEGSDG